MFSILMSVYARERAEYLDLALSSLATQSTTPPEVILVEDGPLTAELDAVIGRYRTILPLKTVKIENNVGLAAALNIGLRAVTHAWVVRFDSDDICLPGRLAAQSSWMRLGELDLFGSQIAEFDSNPNQLKQSRLVPCDSSGILRFCRRRNPFNHMSVCFRRDAAISVGGYPEIPLMEDYALWVTLIMAGARTGNDSTPWVAARVGNGMIRRRGGIRYARSEYQLQRLMWKIGLKTLPQALCDGIVRSSVFLSPYPVRKLIYQNSLRSKITPASPGGT